MPLFSYVTAVILEFPLTSHTLPSSPRCLCLTRASPIFSTCISVSTAWLQAVLRVLDTAHSLRSHWVLSRAKPSFSSGLRKVYQKYQLIIGEAKGLA